MADGGLSNHMPKKGRCSDAGQHHVLRSLHFLGKRVVGFGSSVLCMRCILVGLAG